MNLLRSLNVKAAVVIVLGMSALASPPDAIAMDPPCGFCAPLTEEFNCFSNPEQYWSGECDTRCGGSPNIVCYAYSGSIPCDYGPPPTEFVVMCNAPAS